MGVTDGQISLGNFEVNPLNGNQILIGSATGNLYETTNGGILWVADRQSEPREFQVIDNTGNSHPLHDPVLGDRLRGARPQRHRWRRQPQQLHLRRHDRLNYRPRPARTRTSYQTPTACSRTTAGST